MPYHDDDQKPIPGTSAKRVTPKPPQPLDDTPERRLGAIFAPELTRMPDATPPPELDRKRTAYLQRASAAALALGGLSHALGGNMGASLLMGTSEGYSGQNLQMHQDHAAKVKAYQDRQFEIDKANTGIANDEAALRYDASKENAANQQKMDELREKNRHNKALEKLRGDERLDAKAKAEAEAKEKNRHNKAMEGIGRRNAAANEKRAAADKARADQNNKTDKLTGAYLATQRIDSELASIDEQIEALTSDPKQALLQRDLVGKLQQARQALTLQKYKMMSDMTGVDLQTYLEAQRDPTKTAPLGFPVFPLERFEQRAGAGARGPVPIPKPAKSDSLQSQYGLDVLFD